MKAKYAVNFASFWSSGWVFSIFQIIWIITHTAFFFSRALQIPAEAWLRMSLHHASISAMTILPSGRVVIRTISDSGHLPAQYVTTSWLWLFDCCISCIKEYIFRLQYISYSCSIRIQLCCQCAHLAVKDNHKICLIACAPFV